MINPHTGQPLPENARNTLERAPARQFALGTTEPRATWINDRSTSASDTQALVAGDGDVVPIVYGRDRIGAQILAIVSDGKSWTIQAQWCIGGEQGITEIEQIELNDEPLPASATVQSYIGSPFQDVDQTLAALIPGYDDRLVAAIKYNATQSRAMGIAYSVITFPAGSIDSLNSMTAIIKGMRVPDPRLGGALLYSTNPALICADFCGSELYGWGRPVNDASVSTAADVCDELVANEPRRTLSISFTRRQKSQEIAELLRTYAGVYLVDIAGELHLIPDRPTSPKRTITDDDIYDRTLKMRRATQRDVPTVMHCEYTRTDVKPWTSARATARLPGVNTGDVIWRESIVQMPGIRNHNEAYRFAVERLNKLTVLDLSGSHETGPEALGDTIGDVIAITSERGLAQKTVRLLSSEASAPHRVAQTWIEYDAQVYSDDVQGAPIGGDTNLPDPLSVPEMVPFVIEETPFTDESGRTYSIITATWMGTDWPFASHYRVFVTGQNISEEAPVDHRGEIRHDFSSKHTKQGVVYTVQISIISTFGSVEGPSRSESITIQGKLLNPSNVPYLRGYEAGQFVYLEWGQATDEDLSGYQIARYNPATETQNQAVVLIKSMLGGSVLLPDQPEGTYRYLVWAHDSRYDLSDNWDRSVGFSPSPAIVDIVITIDRPGAQFSEDRGEDQANENFFSYVLQPGIGLAAIPDYGDDWGPDVSWNSEADHWILPYQPNVESPRIRTAPLDAGRDIQALWRPQFTLDALSTAGATPSHVIRLYVATESEYPTYRTWDQASITTGGRYHETRISDTTVSLNAATIVRMPITLTVTLETTTQTGEQFVLNSQAITWPEEFATIPVVTTRMEGSDASFAKADAVTRTGCTLYVWLNNAPSSGTVYWSATG